MCRQTCVSILYICLVLIAAVLRHCCFISQIHCNVLQCSKMCSPLLLGNPGIVYLIFIVVGYSWGPWKSWPQYTVRCTYAVIQNWLLNLFHLICYKSYRILFRGYCSILLAGGGGHFPGKSVDTILHALPSHYTSEEKSNAFLYRRELGNLCVITFCNVLCAYVKA